MDLEKTYINKLYSGQVYPFESIAITTKEYKKHFNNVHSLKEKLKALVDDEVYEKIVLLADEYTAILSYHDDKFFEEGFKHGVKLMTSVLKSED